jgi:death-on-curing protein
MTEPRYLTTHEVLVLYTEIIKVSVVKHPGIHNTSGLKSALAQPQQTFDGNDLYPAIEAKAGALLYSLCQNHPFSDGNKRVAYVAARILLRLNGYDLVVDTHEARDFMYAVASGEVSSDKVGRWIQKWIQPFDSPLV